MPIQPSPIAETSKPPVPSVRFCIASPSGRASCQAVSCSSSAGHESDRGGSRSSVGDAAGGPFAVAAVLVVVGGVDLVVEGRRRAPAAKPRPPRGTEQPTSSRLPEGAESRPRRSRFLGCLGRLGLVELVQGGRPAGG